MQAGDKFNRWTAVRFVERRGKRGTQYYWRFRCDCGNERIVDSKGVRGGQSKSCGCAGKERTKQNISPGEVFCKLTAIREVEPIGSFRRYIFRCVCGTERTVRNLDALHGKITSCGCQGRIKNYCVRCKTQKGPSDFYDEGKRNRSICKDCKQKSSRFRWRDDENFRKADRQRKATVKSTREGRIALMFRGAKSGAGARYLAFDLTKDDIEKQFEAQEWKCARTGIPFDWTVGRGRPFAPSIDRIDNALGYEPANIQLVCYMYNLAKNKFTDADVSTFVHAAVEHQQKLTINRLKLRRVA